MAEALAVQGGAVLKRANGADAMDPAQQPAQDQQVVQVVELRGVSTLARIQGEAKAVVVKETLAASVGAWSYHRQFMFRQFKTEGVLFDDLAVAPAAGAVKLGNDGLAVFNPNLVNAVLVAVQGQGAAIAAIPLAFDGVHYEGGGEGVKRVWACRHRFSLQAFNGPDGPPYHRFPPEPRGSAVRSANIRSYLRRSTAHSPGSFGSPGLLILFYLI